ncbi:MAG: 50S ribosomal protein L18a [Euryarchaeota archaeon]|jgi:large subunit ribosomal protein LX|nr:50S ribosomal protein L18a [Euryarchaeota archaeon]MAS63376.1 50S ribosomal protein L18a [Euryarchaeota archaeon]|tara:strand:- start:928 stop:1185 length:258 start_codon:yes stop_codon:yes gene_type:complete
MNMKAYRITGTVPLGSVTQKFTQDVVASTIDEAQNKVFSTLGGRHKVNRRQISIDTTEEINPNKSRAPKVIHHFRDNIEASSEEE